MLERTSLLLKIRGRVQGVGYREAMCAHAARLGVTGWVRNRIDGSVEALVEGPPAAVDTMLAWTRRGPPAARVDDVAVEAATESWPTFERRATL